MTLDKAQAVSGSAPSDGGRRLQSQQSAGWEALFHCVWGGGWGVGYLDRGQQAGQEELALGQKMGGGRAAPRPVGKEKLRLDPVGT